MTAIADSHLYTHVMMDIEVYYLPFQDGYPITVSFARQPLSNFHTSRRPCSEPAGGIAQAASLNCFVTKRRVLHGRETADARESERERERSRVDNDLELRVIKNFPAWPASPEVASFANIPIGLPNDRRGTTGSVRFVVRDCNSLRCVYLLRGNSSSERKSERKSASCRVGTHLARFPSIAHGRVVSISRRANCSIPELPHA